ncbi:efflux RND transporter periplasmic adaptor subunit [Singulisphaera rosea]
MGRWTALLFVSLVLTVTIVGCEDPQPKVVEEAPPTVIVKPAVIDYLADYEEFSGRTDSVLSVNVLARVGGYLDKVFFVDGTEIKKGDPLFRIDQRPFLAEVSRSRANLQRAEAHLARLEADYHRAKSLFERKDVSREEFDKVEGDHAEALALVGSAKAGLDMADLQLSFTSVTAPLTGRLSRRMLDPGNFVQANETILTSIVSDDLIYVYFDVDEQTLLRIQHLIREGVIPTTQDSETAVQIGLLDEDGFSHEGKINFSENKFDANTGTLRLRAIIKNSSEGEGNRSIRILSAGMVARVRLPIGNPRKKVLIPREAIGSDQGRNYLYVVRPEKRADDQPGQEPSYVVLDRTIKVGARHGDMSAIEDGLKPDELVVVEGLQRLRPGLRVDPKSIDGPLASKANVSKSL